MFIEKKRYGTDDLIIVSRNGKIGSIYEIGAGVPKALFGGQYVSNDEWTAHTIEPKLTVYELIERLPCKGYLLTDIRDLTLNELQSILEQIPLLERK